MCTLQDKTDQLLSELATLEKELAGNRFWFPGRKTWAQKRVEELRIFKGWLDEQAAWKAYHEAVRRGEPATPPRSPFVEHNHV